MRESCTYGSVRGREVTRVPYRDESASQSPSPAGGAGCSGWAARPPNTKVLGACLSIRRISLYTEGRVRFCLAHEQDLSPLENR